MKAFIHVVILSMFLIGAGCSSKKGINKSESKNNSFKESDELILNGDSDNNKAGKLRTVYFSYNADQLDGTAKQTLKSNAEFLKANPKIFVQIEGHCDERGGRQYNLALGERRAKSIKTYLNALGVKSYRLRTMSYGNERPVSVESNETGWSANRRGNFVVVSM